MRTADIKGGIFALGADIVQYNGRLAFMAHRFAETHPDASIFIFNNHAMSLRIKDDPTHYVETETIQKVEGYCYPYAESKWWAATKDVYDDLCTYPLDGYLWRDDYHHKLMARLIVEHLSDTKHRLPFEFY